MLKRFYPKWQRKNKTKPTPPPKTVYKYVPKPPTILDEFKAVDEEEFLLELSDTAFITFLQNIYLDKTPHWEQAGYGIVEDGQLVYLVDANEGAFRSGGEVVADFSVARKKAIKQKEFREFNLQYHTHPDFSTFFSGTDTNDQAKALENLMASSADGVFYFVVFNQLENLCHRFEWKDNKPLTRTKGYVGWRGIPFHFEKGYYTRYSVVSAGATSKGGQKKAAQPSVWDAYDNYDDDLEFWGRYADYYTTQPDPPKEKKETFPYYGKLFDLMGVEPYDFKGLRERVSSIFGVETYEALIAGDDELLCALEDYVLLDKESNSI